MPYTPPLIKPSLPSLPPSTPFPFQPPVVSPPTQTAPTYQPPDLLPPTGLDLQGVVCIYSNSPIWEPKKIKYKYPEENWQEIGGENFSIDRNFWESLPISETYRVFYSSYGWCFDGFGTQMLGFADVTGGFTIRKIQGGFEAPILKDRGIIDQLTGSTFLLTNQNGTSFLIGSHEHGLWVQYPFYKVEQAKAKSCGVYTWNVHPKRQFCETTSGNFIELRASYQPISSPPKIERVVRLSNNEEIPPECKFKVFNIFGEIILNITKNTCPDVLILPEKCYYKAENEKLASKINLSFGQFLEIKYNSNCATVLLYSYPFPNPIQVYKECSDNPNCPPPKIRFDKKCEEKEKCKQCPKGTAAKVLIGSTITCLDKNGCIKKIIKYQPGCNTYDCVC